MAIRARRSGALFAAFAATLLLSSARPALAQTPPAPGTPQMRENCPGLVASDAPRLIPAAYRLAAALNPDLPAGNSNLLYTLNYDETISPEAIYAEHEAWGRIQTSRLPTVGATIDNTTLTASTVKLYRSSDKLPVSLILTTSGGGDNTRVLPLARF